MPPLLMYILAAAIVAITVALLPLFQQLQRTAASAERFLDSTKEDVRRIQEERYGNRQIANDLANPDFVRFAESFGAAAERVRTPPELTAALTRAFKRRDGPTLIEVPVGPLPSPWEFIRLPRLRGRSRP